MPKLKQINDGAKIICRYINNNVGTIYIVFLRIDSLIFICKYWSLLWDIIQCRYLSNYRYNTDAYRYYIGILKHIIEYKLFK